MRVDLTISDHRFAAPATQAWRNSRRAILPLEFEGLDPEPIVRVERNLGMAARGIATAEWVPAVGRLPEYANLTLGDAFFNLDQEAQSAILLHESVHIRLYRGRLRNNYLTIRRVDRHSALTTRFEEDRWYLSWELLTFPQEVGVDKFIAVAECPQALRDRYFRDRARLFFRNGEAHRYDDSRSPSLALYRLFYGFLRVELGLAVVSDPLEHHRLEERRAQLNERLQREAGEHLPWFRENQMKVLAITVDTDTPDEDLYRDFYDRVLALPP